MPVATILTASATALSVRGALQLSTLPEKRSRKEVEKKQRKEVEKIRLEVDRVRSELQRWINLNEHYSMCIQ